MRNRSPFNISIRQPSVAQSVKCPLRGTGGHGFDPGSRYKKVFKNCTRTSCSSLGTQTYGVELGLMSTSVRIM